jgi:hypothetical protein
MNRNILVSTVATVLLVGAASAQDFSAQPSFGSVTLNAGFTPDPYMVNITSGGAMRASNARSDCAGWVANAPDYSIDYNSGNFDLTIAAVSDRDTTLLINDPYGNWYCNDDGGEGLNPLLRFDNPASGRYDIWIGSYSQGVFADSTLSVSEIGQVGGQQPPPPPPPPAPRGPDMSLPASFGSVSLNAGFTPDPYAVNITSGGSTRANLAQSGCAGWVAQAPDYSMNYNAGNFALTVAAVSDRDTTLLINDPYGNWYCNDDGGQGLNPLMRFDNPASGRYDVWIGSFSEGVFADSILSFSEVGLVGVPQSRGPDVSLPAAFGNVSLSGGFSPDPYRVNIVSGGRHRADTVRNGCRGWVADAPDFQLTFAPGSLPLIISAASSSDTTLLVNDPMGNWHCDDDGGNQGLNPALTFHNPSGGVYDIWIGSYQEGNSADASLSISELYSE